MTSVLVKRRDLDTDTQRAEQVRPQGVTAVCKQEGARSAPSAQRRNHPWAPGRGQVGPLELGRRNLCLNPVCGDRLSSSSK